MRPVSRVELVDENWKIELRYALRTAEDLIREGLIPASLKEDYVRAIDLYKMAIPRYYANLIDKNDPLCPIRLQAIPSLDEVYRTDGIADPLQDLKFQPAPNITHRYPNRVLLHLSSNCSMYCRYCFRKSLLNELAQEMFHHSLDKSLGYLRSHSEIEEVIFSGGDPFLANQELLALALENIKQISHIRRVRFHSRVPVTLPMRITHSFVELLTLSGKPTTVVTHFNHPKEVTPFAEDAISLLKGAGFHLLNQSVLLRAVNDSVTTLKELSESLFDVGILPYYLHHLDRSRGTLHFEVPIEKGLGLWKELKKQTAGYLVPRYVVDDVDWPYKSEVSDFAART